LIDRYSDVDVGGPIGVVDQEAEPVQGIQREAIEVDLRCNAMNEPKSECVRSAEEAYTTSRRWDLDNIPVTPFSVDRWTGRVRGSVFAQG
jgi:hypothetical protein